MQQRIREKTQGKGEHIHDKASATRKSALHAAAVFEQWRAEAGLSSRQVREDRLGAAQGFVSWMQSQGYAAGTIHTYTAGACMGLGISMSGLTRTGTAMDKSKSTGQSARAAAAREKASNASVVRFQEMVGGRRAALERLTGSDLVRDGSGHLCVRFARDKGGKTQYQVIAPEHEAEVSAYFRGKGASERIFSGGIDRNIDLHGIRAEHARAEYARYERMASTPTGRAELREQLWARFYDSKIGNNAYLQAKSRYEAAKSAGNSAKAREYKAAMSKKEAAFRREMSDKPYILRGDNRAAAELRGRQTEYDRLALCATSVFALSHWRNEVTVKHYMI